MYNLVYGYNTTGSLNAVIDLMGVIERITGTVSNYNFDSGPGVNIEMI